MKVRSLLLVVAAVLFSTSAFAAKGSWKTLAKSPFVVKARQVPKTPFLETWVEGRVRAPVQDVQAALMDSERYPAFMPYVKLSRFVGRPEADGSRLVYTKLDPPVISALDYVVKVGLDVGVNPDGSGEFRSHWDAVAGKVGPVKGVVRLKKNSGTWHVRPLPDGSSLATYSLTADPGVNVPGFVANRANRKAMTDLMSSLEKEAQRRHAQRTSALASRR